MRPSRSCFSALMLAFFAALVSVASATTSVASDGPVITWDDLASIEARSTFQPTDENAEPKENTARDIAAFDPFSGAIADVHDLQATAAESNPWHNREATIDGYVLPLKADGARVTEFLLVPWVGACIHASAPPPDQIIHVSYPQGLSMRRDFQAVRLSGTLQSQPAEHRLFLVDGTRAIPASYALTGSTAVGVPDAVIAASLEELPHFDRLQIWVNTLFTETMAAIADEGSTRAFLFAMLVSFAYGAVHTLGPGHGKAVVISYFVGSGGSLRRGVAMGARIAVFHVLSAMIVVFLLDLVVRQTTGTAASDYRAIRLGSYALIIGIGAVMVWQAVAAMRVQPNPATDHHHEHGHHRAHRHSACAACAAHSQEGKGGWLAAAVGAVPCTGALLVMLFGLANDLILPAVMMVLAISAGMAIAMSGIGLAAIYGRNWAERGLSGTDVGRLRFENMARLAGSAAVLAIGLVLFTATILQHGSGTRQLDRVAMTTDSSVVVAN